MTREEKLGFSFWDLSFEFSDKKTMEVSGSNKSQNNVEIRARDEKKAKVCLVPILGPIVPLIGSSLFGGKSANNSHERSMTVDVYKKN